MLPDMGGLRGDYIELARHFTGTGCDVVAIDYYGRTAGVGPHAADFDHDPHMAEARRENVLTDIAAAVSHLDTLGSGPTYTLGFCVGGAHALYSGTAAPDVLGADLAGVVAFCPWTGAYGHAEALPDDFISALRVPMLGLFGGSDEVVPLSVSESYEALLTEAGRPHEIAVYPGQGTVSTSTTISVSRVTPRPPRTRGSGSWPSPRRDPRGSRRDLAGFAKARSSQGMIPPGPKVRSNHFRRPTSIFSVAPRPAKPPQANQRSV
jgi:carboxymethylenebutenolidase